MPNEAIGVAEEAIDIVQGARRSAYGTPELNFTRIANLWNAHFLNLGLTLRDDAGDMHRMGPETVAMFMVLMKAARLAESPAHRDSMVDMVGYTITYAECMLEKGENGAAVVTAAVNAAIAEADETEADVAAFDELDAGIPTDAPRTPAPFSFCGIPPGWPPVRVLPDKLSS